MILQIEDFSYSFPESDLFYNVDFYVKPGEIVGLTGPSGSGKSTFFNLIAGLIPRQDGKFIVTDHLSYMWQRDLLLPWRTVFENVLLISELRKMKNSKLWKLKAIALLKEMGLLRAKDKYPHQLSIGMRQRASFAQALMLDPELLLLDEPFAAIDPFRRAELYQLLNNLREKKNLAICFISHQIEDLQTLADRVYLVKDHRIIETETTKILEGV